MTEERLEDAKLSEISKLTYRQALREFDRASCEASAVSQETSGRIAHPTLGLATHVFTRMVGRSIGILSSIPNSRWAKQRSPRWDIAYAASHVRAILEGAILFKYLVTAPTDEDTQRAYVQLMHLYDCKKRIRILPAVLPPTEIEGLKAQETIILTRLRSTHLFQNLDSKKRKAILSGQHLMFTTTTEAATEIGLEKVEFEFIWNYLSQYTHIFSMQFYRMEANGRGTGLHNQFDEDALVFALSNGAALLRSSTDLLVEKFPDAVRMRNGLLSQFTPGPFSNSIIPTIKRRFLD